MSKRLYPELPGEVESERNTKRLKSSVTSVPVNTPWYSRIAGQVLTVGRGLLPDMRSAREHSSSTSGTSQPNSQRREQIESASTETSLSNTSSGEQRSPIDLTDDTEDETQPEAGPSRSRQPSPEENEVNITRPLHTHRVQSLAGRPPPSRPDVSSSYTERTYDWLNDHLASRRSSSSFGHSSTPRRRRSGTPNLGQKPIHARHQTGTKKKLQKRRPNGGISSAGEGGTRIIRRFFDNTFAKDPEVQRKETEITNYGSPSQAKAAFSRFLSQTITLPDALSKPHKQYNVDSTLRKSSLARRLDAKRQDVDLADLLQRHHIEEEEREAELQARLRPRIPNALTPAQEDEVDEHLNNRSFRATCKTDTVNLASICTLRPRQWLNDEVINLYGGLLAQRAESKEGANKIHYFNSFFYQKVSQEGYAKVARWTKKIDIFSKSYIVFPINLSNAHWTAAAINMEKKRIEYYDSMGDYGNLRLTIFEVIRDYVVQEYKQKKGGTFDFEGWTDYFSDASPQQNNGSDCGVFTCQTLEHISRGRDLATEGGFEFTAENMPFIRRMMIWEIGRGGLMERWVLPSSSEG